MLLDKLSSVDMDVISSLRERIYVMKIGWTTSMLLDEKTLINRIKRYRDLGIDVSPGGTTLEIAYAKGHLERTLSSLLQYGFSHLEISEGVIDLPDSQKKKIVDFAKSNNIPFTMEVGKKSEKNQLSLDETIEVFQVLSLIIFSESLLIFTVHKGDVWYMVFALSLYCP